MKEIFSVIQEYADVYDKLEKLQESHKSLLPKGDQKTGVIAEFYARLYAEMAFPGSELVYGSPSEHAWDITVRREGEPDHKIQVKAVSVHSTTSRVSVIHPGWHELYLMRLNKDLYPEGFWTLFASSAPWSTEKLEGATMQKRNKAGSGSKIFHNAEDNFQRLIEKLAAAKAANMSLKDAP